MIVDDFSVTDEDAGPDDAELFDQHRYGSIAERQLSELAQQPQQSDDLNQLRHGAVLNLMAARGREAQGEIIRRDDQNILDPTYANAVAQLRDQLQEEQDQHIVQGLSSGKFIIGSQEDTQALMNNANARARIRSSRDLTDDQKQEATRQSYTKDTEIRRAAVPVPPELKPLTPDFRIGKQLAQMKPEDREELKGKLVVSERGVVQPMRGLPKKAEQPPEQGRAMQGRAGTTTPEGEALLAWEQGRGTRPPFVPEQQGQGQPQQPQEDQPQLAGGQRMMGMAQTGRAIGPAMVGAQPSQQPPAPYTAGIRPTTKIGLSAPKSQAEFDALPPGTWLLDPNGTMKRKRPTAQQSVMEKMGVYEMPNGRIFQYTPGKPEEKISTVYDRKGIPHQIRTTHPAQGTYKEIDKPAKPVAAKPNPFDSEIAQARIAVATHMASFRTTESPRRLASGEMVPRLPTDYESLEEAERYSEDIGLPKIEDKRDQWEKQQGQQGGEPKPQQGQPQGQPGPAARGQQQQGLPPGVPPGSVVLPDGRVKLPNGVIIRRKQESAR